MTLPVPAVPLLRATTLFLTLVGAALSTAHAAGRNHDLQRILIPAGPLALHDRAPGPDVR